MIDNLIEIHYRCLFPNAIVQNMKTAAEISMMILNIHFVANLRTTGIDWGYVMYTRSPRGSSCVFKAMLCLRSTLAYLQFFHETSSLQFPCHFLSSNLLGKKESFSVRFKVRRKCTLKPPVDLSERV